ncbi:MAG TPA: MFS transporter [Burkholderiaceae bacterium]|nr:MFS transporter [Burkholderiaceae bacterium]
MSSSTSIRAQVGTLIVATSAIQLAIGFFNTFIALRVAVEFDAALAGLVLSSYFAGFTAGAYFCTRIILRFGHIRVYAAFAGMVVAATAVMPELIAPLPWLVSRVVIGFGCAGLFVTVESWLNAKAAPSQRGRVFSAYMVGLFVALALGQLLIGQIDLEAGTAFSIVVALFASALVLVSTTRAEPPQPTVTEYLPFGRLSRAAPVAVVGVASSGLIAAAFYALIPIWMQGQDIPSTTIGLFMLTAVLGGLAFQVPVGRLSDRFDRRTMLVILGAGLFVASFALLFLLPSSLRVVLPLAALFGGFMSSLYPICVAHAHERMPADQVVAVSGRLILANGIGSVIGPLVGMSLMERFGIDGVFYLMAAAALMLAAFAARRRRLTASPPHLDRTFTILTPQPTPQAHDPAGATDQP